MWRRKLRKPAPRDKDMMQTVEKMFVDNGLEVRESTADIKECDFEAMTKPEAIKTLAMFSQVSQGDRHCIGDHHGDREGVGCDE